MEDKNICSEDRTEQFKIIDQMVARWKSPLVARKAVAEFTGGFLTGKTLANLDSRGEGPEGGFMACNQKVYPTENLAKWIKDRITLKFGWKPGQKGSKNAKK